LSAAGVVVIVAAMLVANKQGELIGDAAISVGSSYYAQKRSINT
jgi:hypothetical protein